MRKYHVATTVEDGKVTLSDFTLEDELQWIEEHDMEVVSVYQVQGMSRPTIVYRDKLHYEYKYLFLTDEADVVRRTLNALVEDGWEIVAIGWKRDFPQIFSRRRL
jgi:hypothetical protein